MNRESREILALFVQARRKFLGLTPAKLSKQENIDPAQIRAVERCQIVKASSVEKLGAWCGIKLVNDEWRAV